MQVLNKSLELLEHPHKTRYCDIIITIIKVCDSELLFKREIEIVLIFPLQKIIGEHRCYLVKIESVYIQKMILLLILDLVTTASKCIPRFF